jgi:3-phenylpropionate/trans-cinnamate dioxygenase ferredoxin subunit
MGNFVKVGNTSEFADGSKKKVTANDQQIMLARVGTNYYAIANTCPHMGGNLSMGTLEGTVITCPRHGSQYDIKDGKVIRWTNWPGPVGLAAKVLKSPRSPKTYKVKVEGSDIFVEV